MKLPIKLTFWSLLWIVLVAMSVSFLGQASWLHAWWKAVLILLPDIAVPVIALQELGHSKEANNLRVERNQLEQKNVSLRERIAEIETQKNEALEQIAREMKRPKTMGELNAETLRKHLNECVSVTEGQNGWGSAPQIAEVADNGVVTLFVPGGTGSGAWAQQVHSDDLEIVDVPLGACSLRLNIRKRHGSVLNLGEIKNYQDRRTGNAPQSIETGDPAYFATYELKGSPERRELRIFEARDGSNSFLFEPSVGDRLVGDNVVVSKRLLATRVDYLAAGFTLQMERGGAPKFPLYINNNR